MVTKIMVSHCIIVLGFRTPFSPFSSYICCEVVISGTREVCCSEKFYSYWLDVDDDFKSSLLIRFGLYCDHKKYIMYYCTVRSNFSIAILG